MEFFEEWRKYDKETRNNCLMNFIMTKFCITDVTPESRRSIQLKISSVSSKFDEKWTASNATESFSK